MSDCNKCSLSYFAELNILLTALVGIIVAIVAVLIGIGILVLILLLRRRKKKKKNVAPSAGTNTMHASSTSLQELLGIFFNSNNTL
jgi:high-affinity Fe2+/Pb2+ permease